MAGKQCKNLLHPLLIGEGTARILHDVKPININPETLMNTAYTPSAPSGGIAGGLRRAEAWLDDRGKPAWIIAMIAGFVIFWPVGLALLAYMIWSKRMFGRSCRTHRHEHRHDRSRETFRDMARAVRPSGNTSFDAYKAETLRRLLDEQEAFESFLQRLRDAKDKQEFDSFMDDRARAASAPVTEPASDGGPVRNDDPRMAGY
jgi:Protein of unknown function (DUF2852)